MNSSFKKKKKKKSASHPPFSTCDMLYRSVSKPPGNLSSGRKPNPKHQVFLEHVLDAILTEPKC